MTGTAGQKRVPKDFFAGAPFPFPPVEEQHRIVQKVDELMALCDRLEQQTGDQIEAHERLVDALLETLTRAENPTELAENWARVAQHFDTLFTTEHSIDRLKQTILQLAVIGRLVPQDSTEAPATSLLDEIETEKGRLIEEKKIRKPKRLNEVSPEEEGFNLPNGWLWVRLGNFTLVGTGATPSRQRGDYYTPADYPWVSSGETSESYITTTKEKISALAVKETNVTIYPVGTLIVAMYGQGKTRGQVSELKIPAGTNQACAAIQALTPAPHHRRYLKLFFEKSYEELRGNAAGGAQPNLNVGKISATPVPIPPCAEQRRIVEKVDELLALCEELRSRIFNAGKIGVELACDALAQATH